MDSEPLLDVEKGQDGLKCRAAATRTMSAVGTVEKSAKKGVDLSSYGEFSFKWNNRKCTGQRFHVDVLSGLEQAVLQELEEGFDVNQPFVYITFFKDKEQLCTGLPIHLAASRGHTQMVEMLLEHNASVDSMVMRDGEENYDVIQAAVFKEGRGGSADMITFLCQRGSNVDSKNANGQSCMHLAFQTGNMETIRAVRHARTFSVDLTDEENFDVDNKDRKPTPLELGIEFGKMNKEDLARAAPADISSLKVFIHRAPECIPDFMMNLTKRMKKEKEEMSKTLADKLTHKDIARLLRNYPQAAVALLNAVTAKPKVTSEGWHPLPSRVSFAARSKLLRTFKQIFPARRFLTWYEKDYEFRFDDAAYEAPKWHDKITDVKDPPNYDASIQVCYIPNIISPHIFSALASCTDGEDPALFLYDCLAVRAAVSYTFWNGAIWVDVLQFLISIWGLTLLVLETCINHELAVGEDGETLSWRMNEGVFMPSFAAESKYNGVVADWIIAKGIVDLLLEMAQFWGCVLIGEFASYLNWGNLWDISRSIVPVMLLFYHEHRLLHLLIVLIYWMRLLEGVTYSEKIGHALIPLQKLATGLMPAMTFTGVGFCALTHAMYTVQTKAYHLWPTTLFHTFTTLITQGLPEDPPADGLELLVLYAGVLFFSVFVLNIFIGVIGEQYSKEKDQVGLMFISVRASSCLTYLLRIGIFPCNLVTSHTAGIVASVCVGLTLLLQAFAIFCDRQLPSYFQLFAFVGCQMITFIATIQCKGSDYPWNERSLCMSDSDQPPGYTAVSTGSRPCQEKRYLWICEPRDAELKSRSGNGTSHSSVGSMIFEELEAVDSRSSLESCDRGHIEKVIRETLREELESAKELVTTSSRRISPISTYASAAAGPAEHLPSLLTSTRAAAASSEGDKAKSSRTGLRARFGNFGQGSA